MATAQLILDATCGKWNLVHEGAVVTSSPAKYYIRQQVKQGRFASRGITAVVDAEHAGQMIATVMPTGHETLPSLNDSLSDQYSIDERFEFVYQCAIATAQKKVPSLLLTGAGGLGKTHTVMKALRDAGLSNLRDVVGGMVVNEGESVAVDTLLTDTTYSVFKGYSTAKGLYNAMYENRNRVMLFDDCHSILKDQTATELLKAALDSYDERWVTWNSDAAFGDNIPRSFRFTGSVIVISNRPLRTIDQAVRSRGHRIDLSMTRQQLLQRMRTISADPEFMPDYPFYVKQECMDLIEEMSEHAHDLSLRTLINVIKIYNIYPGWKRLAEYTICQ